MKPIYADVKYKQQIHRAGIWTVQITPREWLAKDPVIDFETGRVLEAVELKENKFWLSLQLTPESYDYAENPKDSKSGDFYEVRAAGLLNTYNYSLQQILETLRRSEFVVNITDRNRRNKLIGDTQSGMKLKITHTHKNAPAGEERVQIDLISESEDPPPYYNPDNTPEVLGNYLVNSDGNFLLIE